MKVKISDGSSSFKIGNAFNHSLDDYRGKWRFSFQTETLKLWGDTANWASHTEVLETTWLSDIGSNYHLLNTYYTDSYLIFIEPFEVEDIFILKMKKLSKERFV